MNILFFILQKISLKESKNNFFNINYLINENIKIIQVIINYEKK